MTVTDIPLKKYHPYKLLDGIIHYSLTPQQANFKTTLWSRVSVNVSFAFREFQLLLFECLLDAVKLQEAHTP